MGGVLVRDGNDIRGLLAQVIAGVRREGVCNDDSLIAPDTEAGETEPGNIHVYNVSQEAGGGQGKREAVSCEF
jgi:hypothetical protein